MTYIRTHPVSQDTVNQAALMLADGIKAAMMNMSADDTSYIGLFRSNDMLFDIMLDMTRVIRGVKRSTRFSLSLPGRMALDVAGKLLKKDRIFLGDIKMNIKPKTGGAIIDEIKLNGAGFDEPEFSLPAEMICRGGSRYITDTSGKTGRFAGDFTAWFGVEVSYLPLR